MQKFKKSIPTFSIETYIDDYVREQVEEHAISNTLYTVAKKWYLRVDPNWEIENKGSTFAMWLKKQKIESGDDRSVIVHIREMARKEFKLNAVDDLIKYSLHIGCETYDALMNDSYEEEMRYYNTDLTHMDMLLSKTDGLLELEDDADKPDINVLPWDKKTDNLSDLEEQQALVDNYYISE